MTRPRNTPRLTQLDLMMLSQFGQCHSEKATAAERALASAGEPSKLRLWLAGQLRALAMKLDDRLPTGAELAQA